MGKQITTSSTESNTRKIEVIDNKIIYTLKCDSSKDYMSYDETLYKILCMDRLKPFRDEGRLRIKVRTNGIDQNFYLYDLAIACYEGKINADNFLHDMQEFLCYKNRYDLTTDHIDGHTNNNTRLNLSLMPNINNLTKSGMVARVQAPALLVCCYSDGVYRVHYERRGIMSKTLLGDINFKLNQRNSPLILGQPEMTICQNYICNDADSFVACLQSIVESSISHIGLIVAPPLRVKGKWAAAKKKSYLDDVSIAITLQEELALQSKAQFQTWRS